MSETPAIPRKLPIVNDGSIKKRMQKKYHLPVIGHFADRSVEFKNILEALKRGEQPKPGSQVDRVGSEPVGAATSTITDPSFMSERYSRGTRTGWRAWKTDWPRSTSACAARPAPA